MPDELDIVNQKYIDEYMPAIVIVIIVIVIGLTGNALAVIYYGWKAQKCVAQYLILWLSLNDAITNVVLIDDVVDFFNTVNYRSVGACKMFWVLKHWLIANSLLFMVGIAVERYRHVCHPFAKQCTLPAARAMIAGLAFFSLLISVRYFATGDVIRINITTKANSTLGYYCSLSNETHLETLEEIFEYIDICVHVAIICSLIALYTQIIRKVIQSQRTLKTHEEASFISYSRKRLQRENTADSSCSSSVVDIHFANPTRKKQLCHQDTTEVTMSSDDIDISVDKEDRQKRLQRQDTTDSKSSIEIQDSTGQDTLHTGDDMTKEGANGLMSSEKRNASLSSPVSSLTRKNKIAHVIKRMTLKPSLSVTAKTEMRITIMVTVITIVSMVCFVPYYVAMLLMESNMSGNGLIYNLGHVIWRRTFMINSAINPFILVIFNGSFRRFIVQTLKCTNFKDKNAR